MLESFPREKMSARQERLLARSKSETSLNKLVIFSMREAVVYGRAVCGNLLSDSEIISVCYGTLLRHARRFNPAYGRFFAFAKAGIRGDLRRHWSTRNVVKHAEPTVGPSRPVKGAARESGDVWDDGQEVTPEHEVAAPAFESIFTRERWEVVSKIIEKVCTEQERMILELTYITGYNFRETADRLGVTRSAVQILHATTLRKIRNVLMDRKLFLKKLSPNPSFDDCL